jgi:hypothetical protein
MSGPRRSGRGKLDLGRVVFGGLVAGAVISIGELMRRRHGIEAALTSTRASCLPPEGSALPEAVNGLLGLDDV